LKEDWKEKRLKDKLALKYRIEKASTKYIDTMFLYE